MDTQQQPVVRLAVSGDYASLRDWDEFWGDRRQELQRGEVYLACGPQGESLGYIRLTRNEFLNFPLIAALCVRPDARRSGVAQNLLLHVEHILTGLRVFTTTEESNSEMLGILSKMGYEHVGHIDKVNSDGSRELIFSKQL